MFKQIVVGIDEHDGSRDAIALAERLRHRQGELTLAHVYGLDAYVYRGASAGYLAAEAERTMEMLRAIREETGVRAQLGRRSAPSVAQGLHELCDLIGADLLVVGSSRRGLLGRVILGDDAAAALDAAPCALALAPRGHSGQPAAMREVGVAYNASPESEHAVTVARSIAAEYQAKVSAFEVVTFPSYDYVTDAEAYEATIDGLLEEARNRIGALGGIEPHAAYGSPGEELGLYSASLDLLIVGSRGYGALGRLVHGSVSRQLIRNARCPLLVLTRAARQAEGVPATGRPTGVALSR